MTVNWTDILFFVKFYWFWQTECKRKAQILGRSSPLYATEHVRHLPIWTNHHTENRCFDHTFWHYCSWTIFWIKAAAMCRTCCTSIDKTVFPESDLAQGTEHWTRYMTNILETQKPLGRCMARCQLNYVSIEISLSEPYRVSGIAKTFADEPFFAVETDFWTSVRRWQRTDDEQHPIFLPYLGFGESFWSIVMLQRLLFGQTNGIANKPIQSDTV